VPVLRIVSHSEEQTTALAEKLAGSFAPADLIVLTGPLGSGKTAFVRGLAKGLGLDPAKVNSPSYTFVNEYRGEKPLYHFDLYRINDTAELYEIGWEEYLGRNGLVVAEWGEKAGELLPDNYYQLTFGIVSDSDRSIDMSLVQRETA
jgi:tRNA threonylcarbamoyladenosine biosynthesis protein TsaE